MWYTNGLGSFHAFHAAAVLAVALLMPIYRPQYRKFRGVLEETLGRFEKMAGRSRICEKAAKIVRVLLYVVVRFLFLVTKLLIIHFQNCSITKSNYEIRYSDRESRE
jgi:hypothetical protein